MVPENHARVVIYGSRGFVGSAITKRLLAGGFTVHAAAKNDLSTMSPARIATVIHPGETVINAAGRAHSKSSNPTEFWPSNVLAAQNLAAAARIAKARRFIHFSSAAVADGGVTPPASPGMPTTAYGASKAAGEIAVMGELFNSDVEVVIIRPTGIWGPDSPGAWGTIYRRVSARRRLPLPSGSIHHDIVSIDAIADYTAAALHSPAGVFTVTGPSPMTIPEYVNLVAEREGVTLNTLDVSTSLANPALHLLNGVARMCKPLHTIRGQMETLLVQRALADPAIANVVRLP